MPNIPMSGSSLSTLSSAASDIVDRAKLYRQEMDKLPEGDSRREVYEKLIRELLKTANTISYAVTSGTKGS
jgi:hypothetical protein